MKGYISSLSSLALLTGLLFTSCMKSEMVSPSGGPVVVPVRLDRNADGWYPATKTLLTGGDIESMVTGTTLAAYSSGYLYSSGFFTSESGMSMDLVEGQTFNIYALCNMGDLTGSLPEEEADLDGITYTIPSYTDGGDSVAERGIPMAGFLSASVTGQTATIPVRRLLAKVTANFTCNWSGVVKGSKIYNMNSVLQPFGGVLTDGRSAASSSGDLLSFHEIHGTAAGSASTMTAVFYVPENLQGTVSGITYSKDKMAYDSSTGDGSASVTAIASRCSYIETEVEGDGQPYGGTITYRSYLGANTTTNFDVLRNGHYTWNISFDADGLAYDDWKHDNGLYLPYKPVFESAVPAFVGQRALVSCEDSWTEEAVTEDVEFYSSDDSVLRVVDNGDGTAYVECLAPFSAGEEYVGVRRASDGARVGTTATYYPSFALAVPYYAIGKAAITSYVDNRVGVPLTFYEDSGKVTAMTVEAPSDSLATGTKLFLRLVRECLEPAAAMPSGDSYPDRIGSMNYYGSDGSVTVYTYIAQYDGIEIPETNTSSTFSVGTACYTIGDYGETTAVGTVEIPYTAYNPWRFVNTIIATTSGLETGANVLDDYTLYWYPNPSGSGMLFDDCPESSASNTNNIPNAVVYSADHLSFNGHFSGSTALMSSKIATGTPAAVDCNYSMPSTYVLRMTINNLYMTNAEAIWRYLYYDTDYSIDYVDPNSVSMSDKVTLADLYYSAVNKFIGGNGGSLPLTVRVSNGCSSEAAAWAHAPSGVTSSTPNAISGVTFSVSPTTTPAMWELRYSMTDSDGNALTAGDITSHGAGVFYIFLRVNNPYDTRTSPVALERNVSKGMLRLHLFVWPAVTGMLDLQSTYGYWAFCCQPYCYTSGTILTDILSKNILFAEPVVYTNAGNARYIGTAQDYLWHPVTSSNLFLSMTYWVYPGQYVFSGYSNASGRLAALQAALIAEPAQPYSFVGEGNDSKAYYTYDSSKPVSNYSYYSYSITGMQNVLGGINKGIYYDCDKSVLAYDPNGGKDYCIYVHLNHRFSSGDYHSTARYYFPTSVFGN